MFFAIHSGLDWLWGKRNNSRIAAWYHSEKKANCFRSAAKDGADPNPIDQVADDLSLGDIALSYSTCRSEADAAGLAFSDHILHLLVHSMLHLLGYDHKRDLDATLMEGLEIEILGKLGVNNPYKEITKA